MLPRLKERVAFDRPSGVSDGQGGTTKGWVEEIAKVGAAFRYLRGGETVQAARLEGRQPIIATIRNNGTAKQIDATWRMRDLSGPDVYAISSIVPTDDDLYLEIAAERGLQA